MPFNPLRNEIDKIHLAKTGKTSEQIHSDLLRNEQEINAINAISGPSATSGSSAYTQYKVNQDEQIESGISSILTGDLSLNKAQESVEGQSIWKQAGDLAFGDLTAKMVDADAETKKNINSAASIFKKTLTEGTIEESQKALGELRDKYNKIANSTLSFVDKESLRKSYSDMVEQVNGINRSKRASKNFDAHLSENTLQDREKFLSTFDATNKRLSFALKSKQTKNEDIINQLADLESNRVGSRLYNPEDLAAYKASYFSTDQDLNAGMEMQYNYAIKNAADNKIYDYEKQISDIDNKIKDTYNQEQKNLLAVQKNSLNQELAYAKKLSEKLKPLTVEDTYLKSFYPEEYSRKKAKQKQEVFKNERLAEGDQGSWAETISRNWDYYRSNVAKQLSGIHSLLDDPSGAYRLRSKADYIAPPTFFVGKDLNKNNKIDDSEITRDIHGNKVTFNQVSWTDKKGNTTWNFWSPAEQILPISMDVLNTIFLSKGIGMGARAAGLGWANVAGAAGLSEANTATFLKTWAPRISTMGNVTATTFPRFYAEERSNFKDGSTAFKVAGLRAIVEGLTESITPDVKLFDGGIAYGALDDVFAKLGKLDPTALSNLTRRRDILLGLVPKNSLSKFNAALLMAPTATRRLVSGATQEAFEEVAALAGNYLVDKYSTQQNFEVEETNKLNLSSALDTFIEGFIPSLFISGATNLSSRNAMRQERLSQARWNIANNPEQYKQLIANRVSNQQITKEEGLKKTAAIDNIARRLDSMTEINNIKSLTNLLDDKELQFAHFNNRLFQEDLLNVDTTELSPEQLQSYEDLLANTSNSILSTVKLADKYVGLDETEKKSIISRLFETQANAATNADTNLSTLIGIAEQTRQSLLSVPVNDDRYTFVSEEYKKFQDKIDASIQERLGRFSQTLETNPQNLTRLELQLAAHTFYPAVDRMNAIDAQYTLENSPLIQPTEPGPNAPELIQNILDELSTRQILNEGEFQFEATRNLQNPETKALQERLLAIAELSPEELESGELEEGVHDHLTDSQRFDLAQQLELHKILKEENPEEPTALENQLNTLIYNDYGKAVLGLDANNTRAKILEMNKAAMEARLDAPVVNNFAPADTTPTPETTTPIELVIPGVTPDIDGVVYNEYVQILNDLNEINLDQDNDPEDNRRQIAELTIFALKNLDNLESLNQVRSALLGLYPEYATEIEVAMEKANNGEVDLSGLSFIAGKRKTFLEGVISKFISKGELTVDPEAPAPFVDEAPETPTDEDTTAADNFDSAQDAQNQEIKDSEYTGKGLKINMLSLSKEDKAIDDFPVTLGYNILDAYSTNTRSGKATDLNVRIQSMMGVYEFVLSPEAVQGLKELQSKTSLTNEEKELLAGYLTVNGKLIHNNQFIEYVKEKPSAIGTGVGTVFVDSKGNLLKFNAKGQPSKDKKAFFSLNVIKADTTDPDIMQVRSLAESGKIISSPIISIASGVEKAKPLSSIVNETIYVHTDPFTKEEEGVGKSYFVRPGSVQVVNEEARNKYTGVIIPTNGNSIQAFVKAFNEGTLPKELDESIRTNATEFLNYISRQINSTRVKVDPSKSKLAIRYFKKAELYLSSTLNNKIVVKSKPTRNLLKTKNQEEDLLKLGAKSYKLVDARLLQDNKPFTALVVTDETVSVKQYNTYTDYVKSPEFGATIKREENRKLVFSTDYKVTEPEVDVTNDNVEVIDVVENIPVQPIDAKKSDIERRRQEELNRDENLELLYPLTLEENPTREQRERIAKNEQDKKDRQQKRDEINFRYDLELASLESSSTETAETIPSPKTLGPRAYLHSMGIGELPGETPEVFRRKTLSNKINAKQKLAAKNWVANHPIFKNTTFIFDNTINHPEAYASWSKAGIFLYEGANYAEAYHEAWHEFSQLYLTPEQKDSLYAQARTIYGELSFVELEERLAEDFRAYALSKGKTLPENIKKNKDAKSIFTKIWDFLTNLFTDKKTVDHYFGKLYKGNISQFKRNEANAYFKTLYSGKFTYYDQDGKPNSLSFRDSKALLDDVDSLYTFIANNVFKGRGQSFVNIVATAKNANSVYPYIAQYLETKYNELLEDYNKTKDVNLVPQIDSIVDMYDRFGSIAQYHKQNSTLFDDKIKKELVNTQVEELEKANTEFATFESSVNEVSQKQLASQVLINALKTLPKYENGVEVLHPVFGIPLVGNFNTNWNILQRKLSGSNSYADLYSKVEDLTEEYPQFNQFLEYLPAANSAIKLTSSMNFKNEFYRIFSMPYIEGYTTEIKRNEEGEVSEVRVFQAQSLDTQNIRSSYDIQFSLNFSPYSLIDTESGTFHLNTQKYFNNFPGVPAVPKDEENYREYNQGLYDMLKPLGFNLSENSIELFVNEDPNVQNRRVNLIYNKLTALSATQKYIITPLALLSSEHTIEVDGKEQKIGGETSSVSSIIQYEVDANPQYVNDMRYNAAQKQIWSVNQHTYMTKVISVLNDNKLYPTIEDVYKEMPHLNPENNPNAKGSFILSYLFNPAGKRIKDKVFGKEALRTVELSNLLGIKEFGEGEKTIDSNESQKHFADIVGLVKSGVEEINRLSGKSTTRGLVLDNRLRDYLGFTAASNQTDPFAVSGTPQVPFELFKQRILPLINSEVLNTVKGSANFRISPTDEDGSPKLTYFHKIFTPEQRNALLSAYKVTDNTKSLEDVFTTVPQSKEIFNAFQAYIAKQVRYSKRVLGDEYPVSDTDLFKYHFFSFVSRVEQHKVFFGHPYYYKNAKDIEKRLSMWNAFGSYPTLDLQNLDFLNSSQSGLTMQSQREAYQAYANKEGIKVNPNRANIDQISYLVLEDEPVNSATAKASKYYGKNKEAYVNNKAAAKQDAAAFSTLDFYRKFYSVSTGVSFEMAQEFKRQDTIYKKYLELQTAEDYQVAAITEELEAELNKGPFYKFTIKKLQYAGHNVIETGESVPVGHKYSMKPILPSEIIADPSLAAILNKLHASSADYAVYTSGSKLAETVKPVKLFNAKGEVNGKASATGVIDLKNLKEQVLIENKEDFNSIFSTQFRKLIYKDVRTEEGMELYNAYKGIIESLTGFDKLKFLEQLDNKEKLVEMLIREMSRKNVSETTKDLIKLKEDGSLMHSLDSMIDRTVMESAIVSSVKNAIIRQKVPGAQRVQYPVSLIRPSRKLKYYDIVDGKISKAEAIVSFSKGYYPLLNLVSPVDRQPIGKLDAQGNPIDPYTALTRLNEALNNPKFRDTYANQLAMVAIRVPGQGYNSMENFEIVEFLPEESGEIILVPDEMVVKSGSDYDIDKLFCYDPTIGRNGTVSALPRTPEESISIKNELLDKLKENKEAFREILSEKKALTEELGAVLSKRGFDPTSKVGDLYKELQSYKHADETELANSGVITEADLLKLKERLEKGIPEEKNEEIERIKTRMSKLRAALGEIFDADLSIDLAEINTELKTLSDETNEIKDQLNTLRGEYSNALLLNISERLSQTEIFDDLITPNEISSIDEAVTEFGKQVELNTASLTNIVSPLYQLYVFSLNTYKTSLGTDAKNNVFHSLLQKTTFHREDKKGTRNYLLDSNRTPEGYINFSEINDVDGKRISYLSGQMISAHVDIEKNDGIARINLNNVVTPIVNYVTMAGTRFNDIVKLINMTPAIISYSKGKDVNTILENILATAPEGNAAISLIEESKGKSKGKLREVVFNHLFANVGRDTASKMLLTEEGPLGELRRFVQFLELEEQTRDLATVSLSTDYDTFSPQNFESFRSNMIGLMPYLQIKGKKANIFNNKGLKDVISNTVVSSFQIQQEVLDKFVEVFPISANSALTNKILIEFAKLKDINRKLDYDRFSRTFKNDLLYSLFINNVSEAQNFETYVDKSNPGNINAMFRNLKSRLKDRGIEADNIMFDIMSIDFDLKDLKSKYLRTGVLDTELDYSVDMYKEAFEQGFNWSNPALDPSKEADANLIGDMQGFFKAFAYAGIIGSQLNKKFNSYLPLIPESIYTLPMTDVITKFASELDSMLETYGKSGFLTDFVKRFNENHPEFRNGNQPASLIYYKDYVLSRPNSVDIYEVNKEDLTLSTSEQPVVTKAVAEQLTLDFETETTSLLEDSFASLRKLNSELSKNC
jgi:hypothetical protein